jgi:hypothetical protein
MRDQVHVRPDAAFDLGEHGVHGGWRPPVLHHRSRWRVLVHRATS